MDILDKVDKIVGKKKVKKMQEYGNRFMSGKENPREFIKDYEPRSWARRYLFPGAKNQRTKYLVAAKIMNLPGPLQF